MSASTLQKSAAPRPQFHILADAATVAEAVAGHVARALAAKPQLTLGLATGSTFVPVYAALARRHRENGLSFAQATTFNLDEYVGLPADHPSSYRTFMRTHLFGPVELPQGHGFLPGVEADIARACAAYEAEIARHGGLDLQLLGIGRNGHIGFNEPFSSFDSRTRQVELAASTRKANAAEFPAGEAVPPCAVTMGVATILDARQIVLVATGQAKAQALASAFTAAADPACPASALQAHPHVTVYCDEAAAAGLADRQAGG